MLDQWFDPHRALLVALEAGQVKGGGAVVVGCRGDGTMVYQQLHQLIVT